jgi:hypothetical protein
MIEGLAGRRPRPQSLGRRVRAACAAMAVAILAACGDDTPTAPTPPVAPFTLQCPGNVLGQSTNGAPVTIQVPPPTAAGGVLPYTITCSPSSSTFPIGTTRVACTASDARGNAATCGYDVVVAPPPLPRTSFLAFGDSMTAGEITVPMSGALDAQGFPLFTRIVVPSQSYPTELLEMLRSRYVTQAAQILVTNAGQPAEAAADAPRRFSQVLTSLSTAVVQSFNDSIRFGAPLEGAIFVDLYAAMLPDVNTLIGVDGLHPTEAGYQRMAETFFAAIRAFEGR